jgi:hypothetical protein
MIGEALGHRALEHLTLGGVVEPGPRLSGGKGGMSHCPFIKDCA